MNGMILVDLQKAFDIIDHDIQLKKLSTTGLLDFTIGWFKSCLSNQLFRVNLENCYSDPSNIRYCFSYTRMICHRLLNQICFYMLMTRDLFFRERIRPGNKTSWRRHSVHPSDVARTSQMKHPTTSWWNDAKTSQWYISTTSSWNVVRTSQEDVTTTSHQYIFTKYRTSLKRNTQRRLIGTSPRRPSGTYPRSISTSLQRLL